MDNSTNELIDRVKHLESRALSLDEKAQVIEALEFTSDVKKWASRFGKGGGFVFRAAVKVAAFLAAIAVILSYWPFVGGK